MQAVVGLARALASAHEPMDAVRAAADLARRALGGSMAAISRWERERGQLRVLVNSGDLAPGEEELPKDEAYAVADFPEIVRFLHERWTEGGEPRAWVETAEGPGAAAGADRRAEQPPGRVGALRRRGRSSCVVAPVLLHGRAWGELYVARGPGEPRFDAHDEEFATVLASLIGAGIAQTEQLEQVRRLAFTDPLTGLANRRAVDARLDEALEHHRRDGTVVTLAMCDVNGLKRVNDEYGHDLGDQLLTSFANELAMCAATLPGAIAARLGGDEFCLVVEGSGADEVLRVAEEVCRRSRLLPYGDGVACGVASTGDPIGPVTTPATLFRLADAAQYRAKAADSLGPVAAGRTGAAVLPPVQAAERRRFRGAREG
ncbi:sensor domain-containing diguanylate cyclase [Wenjunlia tyrosinilytica]|uniref:Sensor domain-containing diguanylate cyclase n=2 Tax=Wenjunlia tyrosinilytica TaxID=1544741 RepID=A0A918DUL7_9ACTN|nr:sensor domain-containing diguanylate cyclase [Wenjunlia tyrosinilytica]